MSAPQSEKLSATQVRNYLERNWTPSTMATQLVTLGYISHTHVEQVAELLRVFSACDRSIKRQRLDIRNQQIESLFEVIQHGDETQRAWLKNKIAEHFVLDI